MEKKNHCMYVYKIYIYNLDKHKVVIFSLMQALSGDF